LHLPDPLQAKKVQSRFQKPRRPNFGFRLRGGPKITAILQHWGFEVLHTGVEGKKVASVKSTVACSRNNFEPSLGELSSVRCVWTFTMSIYALAEFITVNFKMRIRTVSNGGSISDRHVWYCPAVPFLYLWINDKENWLLTDIHLPRKQERCARQWIRQRPLWALSANVDAIVNHWLYVVHAQLKLVLIPAEISASERFLQTPYGEVEKRR